MSKTTIDREAALDQIDANRETLDAWAADDANPFQSFARRLLAYYDRREAEIEELIQP